MIGSEGSSLNVVNEYGGFYNYINDINVPV